jgi:hypothetical protein
MKKALAMILGSVLLFTGCATVKNIKNENISENIVSNENVVSSESNESINTAAVTRESPVLNKETDHFKIYCQSQDVDCLEDVGNGLETAYKKITGEFSCFLDTKVEVLIYPDIESFHAAIGNTDSSSAAAYTAAAAIGKTIYLTSPLNPGPVMAYDHLVTGSCAHELTHVMINHMANTDTWPLDIPRWINEGMACYEGGSPGPESYMKSQMTTMVLTDEIPSMEVMSSYGPDFTSGGGYYFTLEAGKFLVEKYGFEKVKQFVLAPDNYKGAFGKNRAGTLERIHRISQL